MGLLSKGTPLSWPETQKNADHVRKHGVSQFINTYRKCLERHHEPLYWGDEVEYMLIKIDEKTKTAKVLLNNAEILNRLQEHGKKFTGYNDATWQPEYSSFSLEGTPNKPYGGLTAHFNIIESNMILRRKCVQSLLEPCEFLIPITSFPRLGTVNFCEPEYLPTAGEGVSQSIFLPDQCITGFHPRFKTLTRNIRERRREHIKINIPVYKDKFTKSPFLDEFVIDGVKPDHIFMDAMGFGMGSHCLQVTFQAHDIQEAMKLYDELCPLCPVMLAISAAAPTYRGYLADIDTRWTITAQAVDDRTKEERGFERLQDNTLRIKKSRFGSVDSYLSSCNQRYNDIDLELDSNLYDEMVIAGVHEPLAKHVAHLFIRDPISLFSEKLDQNDNDETDHFENLQSTNWQTLRFKPPPPGSGIGWRIEFRPMDVQITDFENAAYNVFIMLMTRVILSYRLHFAMPMSKVEKNMEIASQRDALKWGKFYFRDDIFEETADESTCPTVTTEEGKSSDTGYTKMTIDQIFNGSEDFPGLLPLVHDYLSAIEIDVDTRLTLFSYLKLISKRASGEIPTTARWIRNYVVNHPDYKYDSVVSEIINFDLMKELAELQSRNFADFTSKTVDHIPEAISKTENYLNRKNPHSYKNYVSVYEKDY